MSQYLFDGELVTAAQLSKRITAYSDEWLRQALKAGCQSMQDLTRRHLQGCLRHRAGRGTAQTRRLHPMNNQRQD